MGGLGLLYSEVPCPDGGPGLPGVCSIVPILAVLYRVGVNTSIVLQWKNSIKVDMIWHKIQEIEHTYEKLNQGGRELVQNSRN